MNFCNLALFGATGDPVQRLMIPSLHNLAAVGLQPGRWPIAGAAQYSPGVVSTAWNSSVRITFNLLDGPVFFDRHCPVNDIDSGSLPVTPPSMKRGNAEEC